MNKKLRQPQRAHAVEATLLLTLTKGRPEWGTTVLDSSLLKPSALYSPVCYFFPSFWQEPPGPTISYN